VQNGWNVSLLRASDRGHDLVTLAFMHEYSTADIGRLIGLSRAVVRTLVRQQFVSPRRGPRREYRFSFQDLVVLRMAKALSNARISNRRITRSLRELRRRLPEEAPLTGISLRAVGDVVSIREDKAEWDSGSGQYLLSLEVIVKDGRLHFIEREPEAASEDVDHLFDQALELEDSEPAKALNLYRRCVALDDTFVEAYVNCARLLQQSGDSGAAEAMYRHPACSRHPHALFNLAVLLEDADRQIEAVQCYLMVVELDPDFAEAHYNLARLYEIQGNHPHTIRHLSRYRALSISAR
jgi:tetratricopeptide (TPR) repeat protein